MRYVTGLAARGSVKGTLQNQSLAHTLSVDSQMSHCSRCVSCTLQSSVCWFFIHHQRRSRFVRHATEELPRREVLGQRTAAGCPGPTPRWLRQLCSGVRRGLSARGLSSKVVTVQEGQPEPIRAECMLAAGKCSLGPDMGHL